MPNCEKVEELLSDYLDGRAGLDRSSVESHLARCPRCAETFEDLKAISRAFRMIPRLEAPDDLWRRAARLARRRAAGRKRLTRLVLPVAAAAGFALVVWLLPRAQEAYEMPPSLAEMRLSRTFEDEMAEDSLVGASPVLPVRLLEAEAELAFYGGGRR